jgi:hypothetical protein
LTDHLAFASAAHVVVTIVLFLGGVAWLISIRPSHDFGGDADVAQNGAGKLGKEADWFQLERSPSGTCTHLKTPQRRTHPMRAQVRV